MFYLIMDQNNCWGAGKTIEAAKEEACQWLCGSDGWQGITLDELEDVIVTEYESRHGAEGVFVYEISDFDWPEDADFLDGDAWYEYFWKQEKLNA